MDVSKIQLTDGTSLDIKDAVARQQIEESQDVWYGIQWTSENPVPIRIGNMNMHRSLPIQSKMKRCILESDGSVDGYVSDADENKFSYGEYIGASYQTREVMVEIPEYYYESSRYVENGITTYTLKLYPYVKVGNKSKKVYIGAFEAMSNDADSETTKRLYSRSYLLNSYGLSENGNELYANRPGWDYADPSGETVESKRGGNQRDNSQWDDAANSQLGRPVTSLTRAQFRERAANVGTGWSQQYWDAYMAVVRLYVVEYCNFNTQDTFYPTTDSNGFHRGGLGPGLSTISSAEWSAFNGYNPIVPCGVTIPLCNKTGIAYADYEAGTIRNTEVTLQVPSYRGIENPFGHIWKWTDGINILGNTPEGYSSIYTCDDITKFADNTSTGYTLRTSSAPYGTGGWIKDWYWGDVRGDFIPLSQGGSSSSYLYDYSWFQNGGWKVLGSGGYAYDGAACGWFCFVAAHGSSVAAALIGGRLCYTPTE